MLEQFFTGTSRRIVEGIPESAITNEKMVEVLVRRKNGQYAKFVKCALDSEGGQKAAASILQKIPSIGGLGTISSLVNNVQTEQVRREVKKVGKDVKEVLKITKDMSVNVDRIAQGMSVVQSLSILNTAVSAANLGVSIVGFMMVNKKLNVLQGEIQKISQTVNDLKLFNITKVVNTGRSLMNETQQLIQHIKDGICTIKDYEDLLLKYADYLSFVQNLMNQGIIDYEMAYQIVVGLLQNYAGILCKYVVEYYYTHNRMPENIYLTHLGMIRSFADEQFMQKFFDYIYLDCNKSKKEAEEAQFIHLLTIGNAYTQIEDTKELVLALPEKKYYLDLQRAIEEEVKSRTSNLLLI